MKIQTISYFLDETKITCQITYDPLPSFMQKKISSVEMDKYLHLLQLAQMKPQEAYLEIQELYKNHPDVPEIINLYTFVLLQKKEVEKAEKLIEETYLKNSDYLFAKINYADQALRRKKTELIPLIFPSFSLKELYPEKKVFHFTEVRGFIVLMGFYHLAIGQKEKAMGFYEAAMQIDPAHPSVVALEKRVKPSFFQKIKSILLLQK